jgi:hypothetical protein
MIFGYSQALPGRVNAGAEAAIIVKARPAACDDVAIVYGPLLVLRPGRTVI